MKASSLAAIVLLCCAVLVCILYVRARYIEYRRVQAWLHAGTNQVLDSLFSLQSVCRDEPFRELWFAIHELGSTKTQRWLFKRAVKKSPFAKGWPVIEFIMNHTDHPATNVKRLLFPCV